MGYSYYAAFGLMLKIEDFANHVVKEVSVVDNSKRKLNCEECDREWITTDPDWNFCILCGKGLKISTVYKTVHTYEGELMEGHDNKLKVLKNLVLQNYYDNKFNFQGWEVMFPYSGEYICILPSETCYSMDRDLEDKKYFCDLDGKTLDGFKAKMKEAGLWEKGTFGVFDWKEF